MYCITSGEVTLLLERKHLLTYFFKLLNMVGGANSTLLAVTAENLPAELLVKVSRCTLVNVYTMKNVGALKVLMCRVWSSLTVSALT